MSKHLFSKTIERTSKSKSNNKMTILLQLLFLSAAIEQTNAFVSTTKLSPPTTKSRSIKHYELYSAVVPTKPLVATDGIVRNTIFPTPPPPPTDEELHANGLPILVEAANHASEGRMMCTELPENGGVKVSYKTVLGDATKISRYIHDNLDKLKKSDFEKPRTVAHLTEPGSEYLSSMWGVSIASYIAIIAHHCLYVLNIDCSTHRLGRADSALYPWPPAIASTNSNTCSKMPIRK